MKLRLFFLIVTAFVGYFGIGHAITVNKIIGAASSGPVFDAPLTVSILCDGRAGELDCPQYFSPDWTDADGEKFYGITNLTSPSTFVQSLDGGITWTAGPSNPFATQVGTTGAAFALASDGSIIAAGQVDATTNACVVRRSTDKGVSWSTVHTFTSAIGSCDAWNSTTMPSPAKCAKDAPTCIIIAHTPSFPIPLTSNDNGASWTTGSTLTTVIPSAPPFIGASYNDIGTIGTTGGTGVQATSRTAYDDGTGVWLASSVWGIIPVGSQRCTGPVAHNLRSAPSVVCGPPSSAPNDYLFAELPGGVPTAIQTFTLTDAPAFSNAPDAIVAQYSSSTYYLAQRNLAGSRTNVYVTLDNFASTHLIASITPTNIFPSCCRGDIYKFNGKVYFTSGGFGGSAQLFVIE